METEVVEPEVLYATVELVVVDGGLAHKRYIVDGRTVDDGRCGADENWQRVSSLPLGTARCRFCWPRRGVE